MNIDNIPSFKIYLTLGLDASMKNFDDLEDFYKVNIYSIRDKYNFDILNDPEELKYEIIKKEIVHQNRNILIGHAFFNLYDIQQIEDLLKTENLNITRLYLSTEERKEEILKQSQREYKLHNRWLDYPPGYIEEQFRKGKQNRLELIDELRNTNIEIVRI